MTHKDQRPPLTLLTSFLGSGKSTLLNALLQDPSAGSGAVVVNKFGDAGPDHDLIETPEAEVLMIQPVRQSQAPTRKT